VPLKIDDVAFKFRSARPKEMVEADLEKCGRRRIRGDVPADAVLLAVCANNHRQGIPAEQTLDPALNFLVARKLRLL
jgi:hypothetical protein